MTLVSLRRSGVHDLSSYSVRQVLALAGDGRLLDASVCSRELREYFADVEADDLGRYVAECLGQRGRGKGQERTFEDSGLVLQDLINEIGRRLDYDVTDGVYRGRRDVVGFDGIWRDGKGTDLLVEVKTTDAYTIRLETIEGYRRALIADHGLGENSSVLFVVGRDDTGALEAQIRGSPYAWSMRVIGAASLVRLLQVKVNAELPDVVDRIRSVLRPVEYTRVDRIVDLMFDLREDADAPAPEPERRDGPAGREAETAQTAFSRLPSGPVDLAVEPFRRTAADMLADHIGTRLTRRRRSWFESADGTRRAVVAVSKRYDRDYQSYWYALYDTQLAFLSEGETSWLVLCALDTGRVWAVPAAVVEKAVASMNATRRPDGQTYWHVLTRLDGDRCMLVSQDGDLDISSFEVAPAAVGT